MNLRGFLKRATSVVIIAILCISLAEFIVYISDNMMRSPIDGWKNQIVDLAFQIRSRNPTNKKVTTDRVVIVDVDEESIQKLGRPQIWPRAYDAEAISHVASGKPRAIGIDFLYTEYDSFPDIYSQLLESSGFSQSEAIVDALGTDYWLTQAIKDAGCVYLSFFDDERKADTVPSGEVIQKLRLIKDNANSHLWIPQVSFPILPVDSFALYAKGIGSIAMPSMMDGTVRNYQLLQRLNTGDEANMPLVANFPLYMLADYMGVADSLIRMSDNGLHVGDSIFIPLQEGGSFRLNWLGNDDEPIRYIPFHKVMSGRAPAEFFEDKFVFFGTSAAGLGDIKTVPTMTEKIPGVEVHAIAFLNMVNNAFVREVSEMEAIPWFFLIALLQVAVFINIRPWLGFILSLGLVFGEMMAFITWLMPKYGIVFPIATLMLITVFAYIGSLLFIYFTRERRNRKLKSAFGAYVSPEVVEQIIKDPDVLQLGGEKKMLTVLFSDIRGFTTHSEQMDPQQIVSILNNYLSRMSECIFSEKGTIDKFIGDAIMAIFGAPVPQHDHADRACNVALSMLRTLQDFNQRELAAGRKSFRIGIGINTDEMTVGNIGSAKRFDYTVIGDGVNLGSRLEGLTKFFGVPVLVSESTRAACTSGKFLFRQMANVKVKGKEHPVVVHELVGDYTLQSEKGEWLNAWDLAIKAYNNRQFAQANKHFGVCNKLVPDDLSTKAYITECAKCLMDPGRFSPVVRFDNK